MSKLDDSLFSKYESLLASGSDDDSYQGLLNPYGRYTSDDDDVEIISTSNEIVKSKNDPRKNGSSLINEEIEETIHFKRYTKRREHKYTEKEMEEIHKSCIETVVHDYGKEDWYHVSDEERQRMDQLAEINMKLAGLKRTYGRVDQYIEAMRIVFKAWNILAKNNFIHSRKEFFALIGAGKITSTRIVMPKLRKQDKYNMDTIINYISNPELDVSDLVSKEVNRYDSWLDDREELSKEELAEMDDVELYEAEYIRDEETGEIRPMDNEEIEVKNMHRVLSPMEIELVMNNLDDDSDLQFSPIEVGIVKSKYIKGYDRRGYRSNRKKKKGSKREQYHRELLHLQLNEIQQGSYYKDQGSSYMVTHSLFEPGKKEKSFWDDVRFDGNWADDDQVALYNIALREELLKQKPLKERYLTYSEEELKRFYRILEDNGVSTIEIRKRMGGDSALGERRKIAAQKKEDKKIENTVYRRITALNNNSRFKKIVKKAEEALSEVKPDVYY